jgi:hypothetical protein
MQQLDIDIYAVTVCVNYAHLFKHCIPNKRFFKRWVIVTVEEDKDTIKLCEDNDLEYIFSKTLYERKFFKSGAINEGLNYLGHDHDWYLHIDADILIKNDFASNFIEKDDGMHIRGFRQVQNANKIKKPLSFPVINPGRNCLFCLERDNLSEHELDGASLEPEIPSIQILSEYKFEGWGYFQLFNLKELKKVYRSLEYIYPIQSCNAGTDDVIFRNMFNKIISLRTRCWHFSEVGVNWDGI